MNFLPENYQPPVTSNGNYMKFQQGVNLLRILSRPIIGWEIWINEHPKRFQLEDRPDNQGEVKPREFWAMIVWNYQEEKVQILFIHQGSIKKAIRDLAMDPDWGAPYKYDIKITRTGQQLKTNYSVTPSPKSEIEQYIKDAFESLPIYLPALYPCDDPFAEWGERTAPLWIELTDAPKRITEAQYQEIVSLIGDDVDYFKKVTDGVKNTYSIGGLRQLPVSEYEKVLRQVKLYVKERLQKEMDNSLDQDLPF
jgi:hypothetical protein